MPNDELVDLLSSLKKALPLSSRIAADRDGGYFSIVDAFYAGDEDAILCSLDLGGAHLEPVCALLTELTLKAPAPLAAKIETYFGDKTESLAMT